MADDKTIRGNFPPQKVPEILAPAGGPASWAAALSAGADAVYVGLDNFSARTYAENFSLPELKGLVEESHRVGVKVYLAFNALIKEAELAKVFRTMMAAAEMNPDAFIIQDLGLAKLALQHSRHVALHASTLTAAYNLDGLTTLKKCGFSRVVLPRELSINEIADLSIKSPIEVEVFIQGALCFSFSGLCLMSSFLGGRSALRGGCTQPCRRLYQNASRLGNFFSPSDFMAATFIKDLKKLPISAFKIEGRMKGPDYVSRAVSAYRLLVDAKEDKYEDALHQALELLSDMPGRPAGPGFLIGDPFSQSLWRQTTQSGLKLGYLTPTEPQKGYLTLSAPLRLLDRLRLVSKPGHEGKAFKLKRMWLGDNEVDGAEEGDTVVIEISESIGAIQEGILYKTSSGSLEKEFLASAPVKRLKSMAGANQHLGEQNIPTPFGDAPKSKAAIVGQSHPLWFWLDRVDDIQEMLKFRPKKIILPLTSENSKELAKHKKRFSPFTDFVWSLPPISFHRSSEKIRKETIKLIDAGVRDFIISNIGQIAFLERLRTGLRLYGDHRLSVLNHLSGQCLYEMGLTGVTFSIECDQESFIRLSQAHFSGGVLLYLYGRPALFTSRYRPPSLKRGPITSPHGEKLWAAEEGDAFIVQSDRRIFLGGLLKSPKPQGFLGLIIDLRYEPNAAEAARRVKKAIDQGRGSPGMSFNFKRGLQ
ncbi:MAG: U32 family peptidase [Deltaproteobacteria bacterium]|jgi:putative protease|nr:U32 family peptidase [Deltaproteobacteria bacterium]